MTIQYRLWFLKLIEISDFKIQKWVTNGSGYADDILLLGPFNMLDSIRFDCIKPDKNLILCNIWNINV